MIKIKVKIKFYPDKRTNFPSLNIYRPHFVVKDTTDMLGVEFYEYDLTEFDKYGTAAVKLLFGNVD